MPKIFSDIREDLGDWWWRLRTPEGSRVYVLERDGGFYNRYRGRYLATTAKGKVYKYAGDLVIVPLASPYRIPYELEAVPEQIDSQGNVTEPAHGKPKDIKLAQAIAELEKRRIRAEWTAIELGVWDGEWLIGVVNGEMISCPFKGTGVPLDEDELSQLFESHAFSDLGTEYERIRLAGGNRNIIRGLLALAAIGVVVFIVWHFMVSGHNAATGGNVTPTITPHGTPIYSPLSYYLRGILHV